MATPPLGMWEVDVPKEPKAKARSPPPLCASCDEVVGHGTLRFKWFPWERPAAECPPCFHLNCAVRAGHGGGHAEVSRATIRRSVGLCRSLQAELDAALKAAAGATASCMTPPKRPAVSEASGEKGEKAAKVAPVGPAGTGGSARHLAGIEPAMSYVPIKDFVRLVNPSGTAREVFEKEAVQAFPSVGERWGAWLSKEAQKVARSIMLAGNNGTLNPQQVYVVVLYTLDVRMAGGRLEENFYYHLNPSLQKRDMTLLQKIEGYLYYFIGALEALPAEPERVYFRGVPKSTFEVVRRHYVLGRRVHWSGISSISEVESVSAGFAGEEGPIKGAGGPGGIVFHITARSGRKIQHLSAIPSESEVLLLPNFRGIVTRGLYRSGGVYGLDIVEEAEDPSIFVF